MIVRTAVGGLLADRGTTLAAAIAYHVLFSVFPLALVLVAVAAFVLRDTAVRDSLIETIANALPGAQDSTRSSLLRIVRDAQGGARYAALIAIPGLIWAASGMMGAIRTAADAALGDGRPGRNFVVNKLIDILLVLAVGVLLIASVAISVVQQVGKRLREAAEGWGHPWDSLVDLVVQNAAPVLGVVLSIVIFAIVYRALPALPARGAALVVGTLVATVLFEILKRGFAIYVTSFANYSSVYGPLGTVVAFLFFVYLAALILVRNVLYAIGNSGDASLAASARRLRRSGR